MCLRIDVISFAKEHSYYKGPDKEFSFSDVYAPVTFGGARFCDIRVWTMFNKVTDGMDEYWEYVKGDIEAPRSSCRRRTSYTRKFCFKPHAFMGKTDQKNKCSRHDGFYA